MTVDEILDKHSNHPSVISIYQHQYDFFTMHPITENDVYKLLKSTNPKKATGHDNIQPKLIKLAALELTPCITNMANKIITSVSFPHDMKLAELSLCSKRVIIWISQNIGT